MAGVQIVKRGLRKVTDGTLKARLATVPCAYKMTPQTTTGVSPSELLMGKRLRTRLDLLMPNTASHVENRQLQQKNTHDGTARPRKFVVGGKVYVRNFGQGARWLPGEVIEISGPVSCVVQLIGGGVRRCHHDQLRPRYGFTERVPSELEESTISEDDGMLSSAQLQAELEPETATETARQKGTPSSGSRNDYGPPAGLTQKRVRRPPDRYEPGLQ